MVTVSESFVRRMWTNVASWFSANATQVTLRFIPDDGAEPLPAYGGYLRIYLSEGFLAQQVSWGAKQFPALHGGVSLTFLGGTAAFTSFSKPPEEWTSPGARLNYPLTALLPFSGGTVEVQAALYEATVNGPLGTAVQLVSGIASLLGPPLSAAAQLADKVSDGLDKVLQANGNTPVLALHETMVSADAGGQTLRPGHLVVLARTEPELPGVPVIRGGRLHLESGGNVQPPAGIDYLVVRVECRTERDDWRFPELDALIRTAGEAFIRGQKDVYADRRTEAIVKAWNSTDLVPADRKRVALLVKEELDTMGDLGVVPGAERTLEAVAPQRIASADDVRLHGLTLNALLA